MGQLLTFRPEVGGGLTGASKTGTTVSYVYDAQGRKLRRTVTAGSGSTDRDYIDGIEYQDGTIDFVHTSEGIARRSGSSYSYEYILRDHLGNNRYVFDIFSGSLRKLQQDDYYPFGLNKKAFVSGTNLNYLYNGKELQEELGQYDYGVRFYDPVIARFNAIDRFSEKYYDLSLYQYGALNPIKFIDVDGDSLKLKITGSLTYGSLAFGGKVMGVNVGFGISTGEVDMIGVRENNFMLAGRNFSTDVSSERFFVEANAFGFGIGTENTKTRDRSGKRDSDMTSYIRSPLSKTEFDKKGTGKTSLEASAKIAFIIGLELGVKIENNSEYTSKTIDQLIQEGYNMPSSIRQHNERSKENLNILVEMLKKLNDEHKNN